MAALDFPAAPTVGQKYPVTPVAGQAQYTWDGEKWTTAGAQITTAGPATATPLMDQAVGVVGTAAKYAREDHVHPMVMDAMAYSGMQVNGSVDVSQDHGDVAVILDSTGEFANFAQFADSWACYCDGAKVQGQRMSGFPHVPGFQNAIEVRTLIPNTSPAPTDQVSLFASIEGYRTARLAWGTANARPVTIAFWVSSSRAGQHSVTLGNNDDSRGYVATYTVNAANTLEYKVITIPGDTGGAWDKTIGWGMSVMWTLLCGSSGYGTPNVWGVHPIGVAGDVNLCAAVNDYLTITGLLVLPGIYAPTAAQSPLIMRPYDAELLTCQRYYNRVLAGLQVDTLSGSYYSVAVHLPIKMRAAPAVAFVQHEHALVGFNTPFPELPGAWGFRATAQATTTGSMGTWGALFSADARL